MVLVKVDSDTQPYKKNKMLSLLKNNQYIQSILIGLSYVFFVVLFLGNETIQVGLFIGFIIIFLSHFILISRKSINKYLTIIVYAEVFPLARILYAILCLYTGIQHITLISSGLEPVNFPRLGLETPSILAYLISGIYILALIMLLIGRYIQLAWIVIFITGILVIPFSLEIFIKNIINFYAIFIPVSLWKGEYDKKQKQGSAAVLLMGLSFAFLVTGAGVYKLLDPVWQEGLGLYYTMNIPFFPKEHLWFVLDYEWLMRFLNYLTIVVEMLALPLFLFRKTRLLGVLMIVFLAFFLAYPMAGIGVVGGPILIAICPIFLAICPVLHPYLNKGKRFLDKLNNFLDSPKSHSFGFLNKEYVYLFLFWWSISGMFFYTLKDLDIFVNNPPTYRSFVNTKSKHLSEVIPMPIYWRLQIIKKGLKYTRPNIYAEFIWLLELFDYNHLFGRVIFKIEYFDKNNKKYEPVTFFDNNGAVSSDYPLMANEKYILSAFRMMWIKQNCGLNSYFEEDFLRNFLPLIKYCKNEIEQDIDITKVIIQIKPIHQPYNYQGNYKPWENEEWKPFFEIDYQSKKRKYHIANLGKYDFSKLEVDAFLEKELLPCEGREWDYSEPNTKIK